MSTPFDSFVLRCWHGSQGERRCEVLHVQSGVRADVVGLQEAVDWIDAQSIGRGPAPNVAQRPNPVGVH